MNKLKQILILISAIFVAIFFYGKKKKKEGIIEEQNKQIKVENSNLKRSRKIKKDISKLSDTELNELL